MVVDEKVWAVMVSDYELGERPVAFPVCTSCASDDLILRECLTGETSETGAMVFIKEIRISRHHRAESCSICEEKEVVSEPSGENSGYLGYTGWGNHWDYLEKPDSQNPPSTNGVI